MKEKMREELWAKLIASKKLEGMPEMLVESMKEMIFNVWSDTKIEALLNER